MREIDAETAADYLRETGRVEAGAEVRVRPLGWGVSNVVLRVDVEGKAPIILKQAREQLRTKMRWFSRLERIWAETAALELLAPILGDRVPTVLFADRENYLFAMTSAPEEAEVWKGQLLAGRVEPEVARRAGEALGAMHAETANHPALSGPLAEIAVFDELRLDPYYRTTARAHAELATALNALIDTTNEPPERTFVHADFSPKNLLVGPGSSLTVVDFETAHAGDPAFDLGFFVSHLLLKALRAAPESGPFLALVEEFRAAYVARVGAGPIVESRLRRAAAHTAACALARVDGKSPVDYLDEPRQEAVRRLATEALRAGDLHWNRLIQVAARQMQLAAF